MHSTPSRYILYFSVIIIWSSSCVRDIKHTNHSDSVNNELIELSNSKEVSFNEQTLIIGSSRNHYIKDDIVHIRIKNLPDTINYYIKINGLKSGSFTANGDWVFKKKESFNGIRKNTIQVFDTSNTLLLTEKISYEVHYMDPFLESGLGDYLIKGIPTQLNIRALGVACPNPRLQVQGGEIIRDTYSGFVITPFDESDKVLITMNYMRGVFKKEFKVIDRPAPNLKFTLDNGMKCLELVPSEFFPNGIYQILEIKGFSITENKKVQLKNTSCYSNTNRFYISEILYKIDSSSSIDTLIVN
ncbi:MAG: hypothetical protein P1U56_24565 [Saprospiraceae bacterium]|nr:hypothetical protein [Saprospiraceae bacterium]